MIQIIAKCLYNLIAKNMPVSDSVINLGQKKIRRFCCKLIIKKCGKNINIEKGATFSSDIEVGDNSGIGINSVISSCVYIGENVMMGPDCKIYTSNHEYADINIPMIKQGYQKTKAVYIGDDVWIGANVIILPGVKIGNGVVIGAGSIVTKNVPDYVVLGGNPAKILKYRNEMRS